MSVFFFYFFISFSIFVSWFLTDGLNIVAVGVTGRPHVVVIFEEAEVVVLGGVLRLLAAPDEVPDIQEREGPLGQHAGDVVRRLANGVHDVHDAADSL